jgi:prepilin-type N-terminal cleavage/methylation domain-containing protein
VTDFPGREVESRAAARHGFTLIEVLVTIAMISIFSAAAMAVLIPLSRSYTATDVASSAQQVVRMAVEVMANDIRLAGLDPLDQADAGLQEANATSIRFTCDRVNVVAEIQRPMAKLTTITLRTSITTTNLPRNL